MKEQIIEILKQVFKMEHVKDNISQKTCDKWDSLSHLNLIIELEQQYNVSFEPEDIVEMTSLQRIEQKLLKKLHE